MLILHIFCIVYITKLCIKLLSQHSRYHFLSGFWRLCPQTSTGALALPLHPAERTPSNSFRLFPLSPDGGGQNIVPAMSPYEYQLIGVLVKKLLHFNCLIRFLLTHSCVKTNSDSFLLKIQSLLCLRDRLGTLRDWAISITISFVAAIVATNEHEIIGVLVKKLQAAGQTLLLDRRYLSSLLFKQVSMLADVLGYKTPRRSYHTGIQGYGQCQPIYHQAYH